MNRTASSSLIGVSIFSSSFDSPIWALATIIPLREALENESGLLCDTPSVFLKRDVDCLYDTYHIPRESFWIFTPPRICANNSTLAEDTIIIFEEQLKADLHFPLDPFVTTRKSDSYRR